MASQKSLTIFGGNGFLGRAILRRLTKDSISRVTVVSRHLHPSQASPIPINQIQADIRDPHAVRDTILQHRGDVINLVGLLYETPRKGITFEQVHERGPKNIIEALGEVPKAERGKFVQISALGVDRSNAKYARTKYAGENIVKRLGEQLDVWHAIVRPSIIWGPEDSFFNRFRDMARFSPALPLVGGGMTKYQPVFVDDVARAIVTCLGYETSDEKESKEPGATYELGGPIVFTFRQLMELCLKCSELKRVLVPVPFAVASALGVASEAAHYALPSIPPQITSDQVELLKTDNVVNPHAKTFSNLGIVPTALSEFELSYLSPK